MAIYRFSANVISRSQSRSSVAAAAYRHGVEITNDRDGLTHDYSNRQGILHSEIMLPDNAPARFADRSTLWNAVERAETRKDAQLSREIQLALPCELPMDAQRDLVLEFTRTQFVKRGMIADVAIHAPPSATEARKYGDDRNTHAHIMLTTRHVDKDGFQDQPARSGARTDKLIVNYFGGKNRDWNAKELLEEWRFEWANLQNLYLERFEIVGRVDHRTLEAQRLEQVAQSNLTMEDNNHEKAIEHTAKAIALDREPRVYLQREDYQTAMLDRTSLQARLLERSNGLIKAAKRRASEFYDSLKTKLANVFENTKEIVQATAEKAIDKAADKLSAFSEKLSQSIPRNISDNLSAAIINDDFWNTPIEGYKSKDQQDHEQKLQEQLELEKKEKVQELEREREEALAKEREEKRDWGMDFGM